MEKSPMTSESRAEIVKQRSSLIANYLAQLGTAMGREVARDRKTLYCRALNELTEGQLKYAFGEALKHLGEFLPSIEQLQIYATQYKPVDPVAETRKVLERDDKPTDWAKLGRNSGVAQSEIDQWIEEGKAKQREHIAKLEGNPEWRTMAARLGAARQSSTLERAVMLRNGESKAPKDPQERNRWARQRAQETGWSTAVREPGDDDE